MLWDCSECGCRSIAAPLTTCPMSFKERDMATTTTGGASNANALPGETGYVPPDETAPDEAVAGTAAAAAPPAADPAPAPAKPAEAVSEPPKDEPKAAPKAEPKPAPAKASGPAPAGPVTAG
jgi:hypothetical protein